MKSDLENYYKSKKISDDLIILLSDETHDAHALREYMEKNAYACDLKENLSDENLLTSNLKKFESFDSRKASERMIRMIRKKKMVRLAWTTSISVAAMMVLSFFIFYHPHNEKITAEREIIEPTTPVLILGSGEKVNLSDTVNEIITDGYVVKMGENTLTTDVKTNVANVNNTLVIPHGCSYSVKLSDGSVVRLNAGGRLSYPVTFYDSERVVLLESGEAFFSVAKSDKPFIVKTKDGEVKVYGTKFNVRNFKNGDVETVLVEGSVGVRFKDMKETKIKPNQRIVFSNGKCVVENVEVDNYISWTNNSFMYHEAPLSKVIEDIENWYGVKINIGNFNCNVDLYVDRNVTIDKVIKLMEIATNKLIVNDGGGNYSIN